MRSLPRCFLLVLAVVLDVQAENPLRTECLQFEHFAGWTEQTSADRTVLESPVLETRIAWDQLIVSWNVVLSGLQTLTVEARVPRIADATRWYTLGVWAATTDAGRRSLKGQVDEDGAVETDTLHLRQPARRVQVRLTLTAGATRNALRQLVLAHSSGETILEGSARRSKAWGQTLAVPTFCQLDYEEGGAWCSPTSLAMVLHYWANRLRHADLAQEVPEVARGVFDPGWPGTGNWAFNAAYAGSLDGLRACVVRCAGLADLEEALERASPVVVSVSYGLLKHGVGERDDGHLVVVVGFTPEGEVVVNDPGSRVNPRRVVDRPRFLKAWSHSRGTAYLVYPAGSPLPCASRASGSGTSEPAAP